MIDVTVKVSDDEQTLTQRYLIHEEGMRLSHDDPVLSAMVNETIEKFKGQANDVLVKIKYTW